MRTLTPYWATKTLTSDLFSEMDRFLADFNRAPSYAYEQKMFDPAFEVSEADDHYMMSLDLPGIKKEEIKIEIEDKRLTISGERKREASSEGPKRVRHFERSFGAFKKSFALPNIVDTEKIEARYENGVLELYLPKTAAVKPRQVEIQSGKTGIFEKLLSFKKSNPEATDSAQDKAV